MNRARRRLLLAPLVLAAHAARAEVVYPDVRTGEELAFPHDEGSHPDFRTEWWYITGWTRDAREHDVGVQITFFRSRPGVAEPSASRFAAKQLLFAHAALADPRRGRLIVDERAARAGFGLAHAGEGRTDVAIGTWSLRQDGDTFRAHVPANGFTLDLAFAARAPILLQGDEGVSRKGPDRRDASYYYSRPQLAVSGSIATSDGTRDVTGVAWLDHEWSSRYLMQGAVGWDWTGINLGDGGALMAFRIRDKRGETLWAGGTYRDRAGMRRTFNPGDVAFSARQRWRSPRSGIEFPVAFDVRAGDLQLALDPLFADQELDARGAIGVVYWEGAVRASIAGRPIGRGYLELTGYGDALRI